MQVIVSRPTFAELSAAVGRAGLSDLFDEDGNIIFADTVIHAEPDVPQPHRLAAAIADAAAPNPYGDDVYHDEEVRISTSCRHDGVHLIEHRPGRDPSIVILPKQSLHLVAGDLIECLSRPELRCSSASLPAAL